MRCILRVLLKLWAITTFIVTYTGVNIGSIGNCDVLRLIYFLNVISMGVRLNFSYICS